VQCQIHDDGKDHKPRRHNQHSVAEDTSGGWTVFRMPCNPSGENDMTTKNNASVRLSAALRKNDRRCNVCGKTIAAPQHILSADSKQYCDACYRECFFDDVKGRHRRTTDRCGV
jgi:hypothetical protein